MDRWITVEPRVLEPTTPKRTVDGHFVLHKVTRPKPVVVSKVFIVAAGWARVKRSVCLSYRSYDHSGGSHSAHDMNQLQRAAAQPIAGPFRLRLLLVL